MNDYRKMLEEIGGYENEMIAVPAGAVREMVSEIEMLRDRYDAIRDERDHNAAGRDHAIKILSRIHMVIYPMLTKLEKGTTLAFRPPNPHEYIQAISDRIRAIPDEINQVFTPDRTG